MRLTHLLVLGALALGLTSTAWAQGSTAITYQGRLDTTNGPANGLYDFRFYAYTSETGYTGYVTDTNGVPVSNGLFTVKLDFGPGVFTGEARWLQIWVRTNSLDLPADPMNPDPPVPAPYAVLAPRQLITATPFAHFATLAGGVAPGSISGVSLLSNSVTGAKIAPGQVVKALNGLTDVVALSAGTNVNIHAGVENDLIISAVPGSVVTNAGWGLAGNSGTTPGVNFVGTTDGQPLEFRAGNQRALRLEFNSSVPNVIGGGVANSAGLLVQGGAIGGGTGNTFPVSSYMTLQPTIGGGSGNTIEAWAYQATIGGGTGNRVQFDGDAVTIAGGSGNVVGTNADFAVISGGSGNRIANVATYGVIPGGNNNSVGASGGFAAGRDAHVSSNHVGSFLWNDGTVTANSTGANRFEVHATGGVNFYTGSGGLFAVQGNGFAASPGSTALYGASFDDPGFGVYGIANSSSAVGVYGGSYAGTGGFFEGGQYGIRASSTGGTAGRFNGLVQVNGTLQVSGNTTLAGATTSGNITLTPPAVLNFGNSTRQMLNLYNNDYAIGIQNNAQYSRSASDFYWFKGGTHSDTPGDAGTNGTSLMHLDSAGTLFVKVLTITGGADVAEPFEMSSPAIVKGAVVIIDDEHPGQLKLSERAYDTRVAGIVSGANGISPGLSLRQQGALEGGQNVALSGRVYVQADARHGAIKPGDLLTTSELPGFAMKVTDHAKAQGAILGKAMSPLPSGQGLVLVLVSLQ